MGKKTIKGLDYPLKPSKKLQAALRPGSKTGHVAVMSPKEFLEHANHLPEKKEDRLLIDAFKGQIKEGKKFKALKLLGHNKADGRHRATAAEELGIKEVPVIDYRDSGLSRMKGVHAVGKKNSGVGKVKDELRKKRASGGSVPTIRPMGGGKDDAYFRRLINWSFAVSPLLGHKTSSPYDDYYYPKAHGGEVDRHGYATDGGVDDIDAAIRAANEVASQKGMTHEKGFSGNVEFAPMSVEEPLTHAKLPLGSYPKGTTDVIQPALQAVSEIAPYFTPAAPLAAARDVAVGLREGDPEQTAMAAFGLPGKYAKALTLGASAFMPDEAEASPIDKALGVAKRIISQAGEHGDFIPSRAKERDPRRWHDISNTVLSRPLGEMSAEHEIVGGIPERKIIKPEDLAGTALIPALGDRTAGGALLTRINEQKLDDPTVMQAGHSFMFRDAATGPDKAVWASDPNIIKMLSNKAKAAVEAGYDPHLIYTAMGSRSGDYSHHMTDTLLNMFKDSKVTKKNIEEFDRQMRENTKNKWKGYKDFPGMNSPDLVKYLYETGPAKARTKLAELMGQGQFQKAGFPDVGAARFGITDPELLHALDLSSGRSISRLDPSGKIITDPKVPHKTYKHQIAAHPEGGYVGGFEYDVPFEVMNKEFIDKLLAEDADKYANPSQLAYTYRMNAPTVYATPEWVDRVSKYLEKKRKGLIP